MTYIVIQNDIDISFHDVEGKITRQSGMNYMDNYDEQNENLRMLKEVEEQYKIDHDDIKLMNAYEKVFVDRHSTLISQSRWFKLVGLYIKFGEYDKAAEWLEILSNEHSDYYDKIQVWYDKLEKKAEVTIDRSWQNKYFLQYPDVTYKTKEDSEDETAKINMEAAMKEREFMMEDNVINVLLEILKEIKQTNQEVRSMKNEIKEIQKQLKDIQKQID